jgi:uncharacterized DUF497 family protein
MNDALFDWDDANIGHIAEHEAMLGDLFEYDFDSEEGDEKRWSYLAETSQGRILRVLITMRDERMRVVTAFDPPRHQKLLYLEMKAG